MKLIHFPDAPNQKLGVQNDRLNKVFKTEPDKEFGLITFFVFNFLSLSSNPSTWFSISFENEYCENPENQPKWLANLLILN